MNAVACRNRLSYILYKIMDIVNMNKTVIQKEFGILVRNLRAERNMSQLKLAELGDFERTYISDLERGLKHPSLHTVIKIGVALDINPGDIVSVLFSKI